MKNLKSLFLALAVIAMPMAFTSCDPTENNGAARITFDAPVTNDVLDVSEGAEFVINGVVRSDEGTRIDNIIARVTFVAANGTTVNRTIADSNDRGDEVFTNRANNHYTFRIEREILEDYLREENLRLTIVANVRNGDQSERTLTINYVIEPDYTELGAPRAFTWFRAGSVYATGLEEFGLTWRFNTDNAPFMAIIRRPDAGGAQRFVRLDNNAWTTITTVEDLAAAVAAGTDLIANGYRQIPAVGNHTNLNIVLAVKTADGEYIMIRVEGASSTLVDGSTHSTITGNSKR